MKRRILTISLIVASLVLLVSVGFAGWVISQKADPVTKDGEFTAYGVNTTGTLTVETGDVSGSTFTAHTGSAKPMIIFGKDVPSPDLSNPWLSFDNEVLDQQLEAYIKISYTKDFTASSRSELFNVVHSFIKSGASHTVDSNLIGGPVITEAFAGTNATYSDGVVTFTGSGSIVLKVTYKFGPALSDNTNENPYKYFNSKTMSETAGATFDFNGTENDIVSSDKWSAVAQKALAALNAEVTGLTFNVTITQQ